jgi:dihydroorotate dehydrogenase
VDDALERLDAGAALIQIYTGLIYEGPGLVRDIHRALLARA